MKPVLFFCIIVLLSIPAVFPLFQSGFFPMHDDTQVARVHEMGQALKDGVFPVRIVTNLGYGYTYPIFNFYAPLAYYVGGLFTLLGFSSLTGAKLMIIIGVFLSGLTMYLLGKEIWGRFGGVLAALLYVYAPYHALDIYVRGDVSEIWAYGFIPLAFYGLLKLYRTQQWWYVIAGSVGYAGIILSHNLTALMVTPFLFLFTIIIAVAKVSKKKRNMLFFCLPIVFGIVLSSFYWIPALAEMKYTNVLSQIGGGAHFIDHFVCPSQLWESQWGYGGSVKGCLDGMSYRVGKLHLLGVLVTLVLFLFSKRKNHEQTVLFLFFMFSCFLSVLLLLPVSEPLWSAVPFMSFFQYPWRFLILVSFFSSILIGSVVSLLPTFVVKQREYMQPLLTLILVLVGIGFLYLKLFVPQSIEKREDQYYTNKAMLRYTTSKLSDEYLPMHFTIPTSASGVVTDRFVGQGIRVSDVSERTGDIRARIQTKEKTNVLVKIAYFPSWEILINGVISSFQKSNQGLLLTLPPGEHVIRIHTKQTPIELLSTIISIIGIITLSTGIIYHRKAKHYAKS